MSRRNQPYIPLYADDFQTDEKLVMCSAESTGVFIRIMCLMHKSEPYGKILLKQKFKQTGKQILDFASQLAIYFPYDTTTIERALTELVEEDVLQMDGDFLVQKRMVRDAEISEIRGNVGKQGGKKSAEKRKSQTESDSSFASDFAQAKSQPNTGIGIGIGNEVGIVNENGLSVIEKKETGIVKIDHYQQFIQMVNRTLDSQFRGDAKSKKSFTARMKDGYTIEQIEIALKAAMQMDIHRQSEFAYLTPEFITRQDKLEMYINRKSAPVDKRLVRDTKMSDAQRNIDNFVELMNQNKTNDTHD